MSVFRANTTSRLAQCLMLGAIALSCAAMVHAQEAEEEELVMDRLPFDRITLNAENDGAVLDVVMLDLPDRKIPDPLPTTGELELRRLNSPSTLYTVEWNAIAKIELFEELILQDALRLIAAGDSNGAFRTLQFLHDHYPDLPGLHDASEQYVKREALDAFSAKRYDESLAIMLSLYDINPQHRGLAEAVQTVSDRVITAYLAERNFAAARGVLDTLKQGFPALGLQNIATWEQRFHQGAESELAIGRKAFQEQRYSDARIAVRRAVDIVPDLAAAVDLLREVERVAPQLMVGVEQLVTVPTDDDDLRWAPSRVRRLTDPQLVEMVDFGAEGGIYRSPWAELESDDTGLRLDITLLPRAQSVGITPEKVVLALLQLADPDSPKFQANFAALFQEVTINEGRQVSIHWRQPHVRPEALVRLSLADLTANDHPVGVYLPKTDETAPQQLRYELPDGAGEWSGPRTIIERVFDTEEESLAALLQDEISVLQFVPPWQLAQLEADSRVVVGTYRLPTVHVLKMNPAKPLLDSREFRRALCYGIDREAILHDLILAKEERPGFRTLTGPMPAGLKVSDAVGYAYNQQLAPRPYEPRLASVLATVARAALAKKEEAEKAKDAKAKAAESTDAQSKDAAPKDDKAESSEPAEEEEVETPPLVLIYPPDPVARVCCQAISLQLTAVGIPIELKELSSENSQLPAEWDLQYSALAIREPLVDARRLLGPKGSAGTCSPSMSLALERVDQAKNWREARERLQDVHKVAYYDLPVIPLWQTIDAYAYRKSLEGPGEMLVTLYQDVADWRIVFQGGSAE